MQREMSVKSIGLTTRVVNLLEKDKILTVADLIQYSETELLNLPGIGNSAVEEIRAGLKQLNIYR